MKFLAVYTPDPKAAGVPQSEERMAEMGRFVEESMKSGVLLATGGLLPVSMGGVRMRSSGGKITVMDGPFTESKELIAGFALLEVNSIEEAIESGRRFLEIAGDGESEIRQIMGPEANCPQV
jgi:hypothetical protein